MCAIIDNDVVKEAFGDKLTPAGQAFRKSVDRGQVLLVVGGKLLDELDQNSKFRLWRNRAVQNGKAFIEKRTKVDLRTGQLRKGRSCVSNDEHVIALAQVTGARLLFSNDKPLRKDFKNKRLIDHPRGKIYSTNDSKDFTKDHRNLLGDRLCADHGSAP